MLDLERALVLGEWRVETIIPFDGGCVNGEIRRAVGGSRLGTPSLWRKEEVRFRGLRTSRPVALAALTGTQTLIRPFCPVGVGPSHGHTGG
jgi:hypothetical protein